MSETLTLKKGNVNGYTPASELVDLKEYINRTFVSNRHGQITAVKLSKVKNRDVYLDYPGERKDGFSLSQAKFRKLYQLAPAA